MNRVYRIKEILKNIRKNLFVVVVRFKLIKGKDGKLDIESGLLDSVWPKKKISCYSENPRKHKNTIDLSLIVPVYNSEIFIERLVDCLGGQRTRYKYEVIFVDDGSTDETAKIINKKIKKYPMMKALWQENGGASKARNAGLDIARGKYIGFIDSDDYVSSDYIERLLNVAYKENADIVKCGDMDIRDGKVVSENGRPDEKVVGKMNEKILNYPSYVWAAVYKTELLENISFPDSYWYEDMIVRFLLYRRSRIFVNISEPLYFRVLHDNQITNLMPSSGSAQCLEHLYLIEQLVDENIKNDLGNDVYLYINVLLECSGIMVNRISGMDDKVKRQAFARVYKLLNRLYKDEYANCLRSGWKFKNDIIMKKRYDLWRMEKYL